MRVAEAPSLMRECYRILRAGGLIRVAVPDLESIATAYLAKLALAVAGDVEARHEYDWMMLEMYDQCVRENSGGEMLAYLAQDPLPAEDFVYSRIGEEGRVIVGQMREAIRRPQNAASPPSGARTPSCHTYARSPARRREGIGDRAVSMRRGSPSLDVRSLLARETPCRRRFYRSDSEKCIREWPKELESVLPRHLA
jgi:hypothetical protein